MWRSASPGDGVLKSWCCTKCNEAASTLNLPSSCQPQQHDLNRLKLKLFQSIFWSLVGKNSGDESVYHNFCRRKLQATSITTFRNTRRMLLKCNPGSSGHADVSALAGPSNVCMMWRAFVDQVLFRLTICKQTRLSYECISKHMIHPARWKSATALRGHWNPESGHQSGIPRQYTQGISSVA